jgi:Raf kinase inhibitor-like YbhB/YbcL family protein
MPEPASIFLSRPAFGSGQPIPRDYTADGRNVSPPLRWGEVPHGTRSLALICADLDAPPALFAYWVAYNLSPEVRAVAEGLIALAILPSGSAQLTNDFHTTGYGGPSPPSGRPHRYLFHLFALDTRLDLAPGATPEQFLRLVQDHVLGHGQLMGIYGRSD